MELKNKSAGWQTFWDDDSLTPFAVNGDKVITYDDERSLSEKVRFAMEKKLAGAMVWSLDTDDFQGDCAEDSLEKYNNFPLMRSINKAIEESLREIERIKENVIEDDQSCANYILGPYYTLAITSIALALKFL